MTRVQVVLSATVKYRALPAANDTRGETVVGFHAKFHITGYFCLLAGQKQNQACQSSVSGEFLSPGVRKHN